MLSGLGQRGMTVPKNEGWQSALPQFRDLAADARRVIGTIGDVAERIGRDPSRFFPGIQTPEYRNKISAGSLPS